MIIEKLPLFVLSAAACAVTILAQKGAIHSAQPQPLLIRAGNALTACITYVGQMIWPVNLAVLYPFPDNGPPIWKVLLAGILLAALFTAAWCQRQTRPWLLVGLAWYLVMLLPVLGLIQVGAQAHADRYTYLPQIGIYVAVTWLVAEWVTKLPVNRLLVATVMAGVLAVLAICAWKQTRYWKSSETLWTHTLACTTGNYIAHYNFGLDLFDRGKAGAAMFHYRAALQIKPDEAQAWNALGHALRQQGKTDEAIADYQKALRFKPEYADAHYNLAIALTKSGKMDEAIAEYQKALQINPDNADTHNNLGDVLLRQGKVDDAIEHFQKALAIDPSHEQAHNNLGNALLRKGSAEDAIVLYQSALEADPNSAEANYNLGNALLQIGRVDEAITHFQTSLQLKPGNADACFSLGSALLQKGSIAEAMTQFQNALRLKPDHVDARVNLGNLLLQNGSVEESMANFQLALQIKPDDAKAHNGLGNALLRKGNSGDAIVQFQAALQLKPDEPGVLNNLAWLLATCPDKSLRNGNKAVELARQANTLAHGKNPVILHTLAAASAEAGQFGDAMQYDRQAMELARAGGQQGMVDQINRELRLYEAGHPFQP